VRSGLASRLAKLEARRNPARYFRFPHLVFCLCDYPPEAIIGFRADGAAEVMRTIGEPLSALEERAWGVIGGHHLFAIYADSEATPTCSA